MVWVISSIVNFGVALWILVRFGKRPFYESLESRSRFIRSEIEYSKKLHEQHISESRLWEERYKGLEQEVERLREELEEGLLVLQKELGQALEHYKSRQKRELELLKRSEYSKAYQRVKQHFVDRVFSLCRERVGERVDKDRAHWLKVYLEKVAHVIA